MKIEFNNTDNIDISKIKDVINLDFDIVQLAHTETKEDDSVEFFGVIIDIIEDQEGYSSEENYKDIIKTSCKLPDVPTQADSFKDEFLSRLQSDNDFKTQVKQILGL
jgi:hypothetical protein